MFDGMNLCICSKYFMVVLYILCAVLFDLCERLVLKKRYIKTFIYIRFIVIKRPEGLQTGSAQRVLVGKC